MFSTTWTRFGEISLAPDGGELADPSQSVSNSMNNGATPDDRIVVGLWNDSSGHRHGFVVQNGNVQSYDIPGSNLTAIWDINPGQEFVGTYLDNTNHRHGFLQFPDGSPPVTIDYPGAVGTLPYGVNAGRVIVDGTLSAEKLTVFCSTDVISGV